VVGGRGCGIETSFGISYAGDWPSILVVYLPSRAWAVHKHDIADLAAGSGRLRYLWAR
jgi:hypothetical protein